MPLMRYKALDQRGRTITGFSFAVNDEQLRSRLRDRSRFLLESKGLIMQRGLSLEARRALFHELGSLVAAGVNLSTALGILAEEDPRTGPLFARWKTGIEEGKAFSACIHGSGEVANPMVVKMIEVGEATGEMGACLQQIAAHYEALSRLRNKIISALTYPVIVLVVSLAAVLVLTFYVIPMFLEMFQRYRVELPPVTKILLAFTAFLDRFGMALPVAALLLFFLVRSSRLHQRAATFRVIERLPLVGRVFLLFRNLNLLRNLANLLRADVRVHDAVRLLVGLFINPELNQTIKTVADKITRGDALSGALKGHHLLSTRDLALIRIGEETGTLAHQADHLAADYEARLDRTLERFLSLFEPVMIIALSAVVGFILVALYLPLFSILGGSGP